jgi:exonuclease III
MSNSTSSIPLICWNVRGIEDRRKCDMVKETLLSISADIVLLQETKLNEVNRFKSSSFLPGTLQNFVTCDAVHSSRGHLIAWNSIKLKLLSSSIKPFSISTQFENQSNGTIFWITNIYDPNGDEERPAFFQEIRELTDTIQGHGC